MPSAREAEFRPISPNPFIVGNPVRGRTMFFGRESEFELVRKRFTGSETSGLLIFCGERRSGKTSILFQIMDGRLGPEFIPILIDMQSMAIQSEVEFLTRVAQEIYTTAGLTTRAPAAVLAEATNPPDTFYRLVCEAIAATPGRKLVLLFDEYELFENKIDAGALSSDVLQVLASLMEHQSVFIIFTGSQNLEDRRREYWRLLGRSLYRTISYLERSDALNLIQRPVAGEVTYGEGIVESIYRLTAGQPFYTQAVCQNLVDRLNDAKARVADQVRLTEVVEDLVENALPQMIFLWEGLEQDEKLVLALLGECLPQAGSFAAAESVHRRIRKRKYPLDLSIARVSTVLEKLFKQELLLKDASVDSPGYSFRMDLWRLWIRRMHSVWQAAREAGIDKKLVSGWSKWTRRLLPLAVLLSGIALVWWWGRPRPMPPDLPHEVRTGPPSWLKLDLRPEESILSLGGRRVAIGSYHDSIQADRTLEFTASAAGYADSLVPIRGIANETLAVAVFLRPLLGDLRVDTNPSGAEIRVDGRIHGRSPILVPSLDAPTMHRVEATLAGRGVVSQLVRIEPNATKDLHLLVPLASGQLDVTSEPSGAHVMVGDAARGSTPISVGPLSLRQHSVKVGLAGYEALDTSLVVQAGTNTLHARLIREPPGSIIVKGDRPAQMFVDDDMVMQNNPNSDTVRVQPGSHHVLVVYTNGEKVDSTFAVASRELVVFDFSRRTLRRSRP